MKKRSKWTQNILIIASLIAAGLAMAEATRTAFSTQVTIELGVPEKVWVSDGITHVRNQPYFSLVPVTIAGVAVHFRGVVSYNADAEGNGTDNGTFLYTAIDGSGSWEGRFSGIATGGLVSNRFVGQGSGALDRTTIQGTYVDSGFVATLSGEILKH
ncbi:MAG: hypothetical protein DME24_05775 [Verrucomicrobia bacterium]|nr:MAG: hypothetical protein DME24_05775 [Verrucomicrobiota bacterium]